MGQFEETLPPMGYFRKPCSNVPCISIIHFISYPVRHLNVFIRKIGFHNRNNVNGITNGPKLGNKEKRKLIKREREPKQKETKKRAN